MSSESDSTSSSSSLETRRKLCKKLKAKSTKKIKKHKKEKKKKNRKEKKRTRNKSASSVEENCEIQRPHTQLRTDIISACNNTVDTFGPVLPPHLAKKPEHIEISVVPAIIGPIIPRELLENKKLLDIEAAEKFSCEIGQDDALGIDEKDLQDSYGPMPIKNEEEMSVAQIQLEKRALELKLAAIDGTSTTVREHNVREEWMLELPDVGLKSGLAALNNIKRGFHQGKEKPDFSDR